MYANNNCLYKYIIQGHSLRGMFNVLSCHSKNLKRSISLNCRKVNIVTSSITNGVIVSLKKLKIGFYNSNQLPLRYVKSVCCRNRIQRRLFRLIRVYAYEGLAASTPVKTMPEDPWSTPITRAMWTSWSEFYLLIRLVTLDMS